LKCQHINTDFFLFLKQNEFLVILQNKVVRSILFIYVKVEKILLAKQKYCFLLFHAEENGGITVFHAFI